MLRIYFFRKFDVIYGWLLTAMYNYFVPWYWYLIFLGQLQHCATIPKFLCDFCVLPHYFGANNCHQLRFFPPGQHLCLLGMTLCPNYHTYRLCVVLRNNLKIDNIMWLKVGVYFIIQADFPSWNPILFDLRFMCFLKTRGQIFFLKYVNLQVEIFLGILLWKFSK